MQNRRIATKLLLNRTTVPSQQRRLFSFRRVSGQTWVRDIFMPSVMSDRHSDNVIQL